MHKTESASPSVSRPWLWWSSGMLTGLTLSAGIAAGMWMSGDRAAERAEVTLPPALLQATATHGGENFAVATGPVGDDVEGVFFLDFLTGELQGWVLNARTGKWGGAFKTNVVKDLGVERGKKPSYLMVTGAASFKGGGAANALGSCVVYVVDANTGGFAAYGVPWSRTAASQGAGQANPLILMDGGKARSLQIRE